MEVIVERDTVFEEVKESVRSDEKGRILLGREFSGRNYRVARSETGEILLVPVAVIPERDMWLYRNPKALAAFHQGLADAGEGRVTVGEDFSQFKDDAVEED